MWSIRASVPSSPDASGRVQIALDETRRRVVEGSLEDGNIRRLLLAAAREEDNPAVRVESVGLLKEQPATAGVREVLLSAARNDPSPAVRLKAVEALKPMGADAEVRRVLAQVLMTDENPGVRIRAIDLLVEHCDGSMVGLLQTVVQRDNNSYVRIKSEKALQEMNASIGDVLARRVHETQGHRGAENGFGGRPRVFSAPLRICVVPRGRSSGGGADRRYPRGRLVGGQLHGFGRPFRPAGGFACRPAATSTRPAAPRGRSPG
jgi:hypothetical protein